MAYAVGVRLGATATSTATSTEKSKSAVVSNRDVGREFANRRDHSEWRDGRAYCNRNIN